MSRLPRLVLPMGTLALATVAALTGCSAGQVTQTSTQVATVNGSSANVGQLALRDIRILYPSGGSYAEGSTAQLVLVVTNQGLAQDTLLDVTGEFFDEATYAGDGSDSDESSASATGSGAAAPPADPSDGGDQSSGIDAEIPAEGSLQFGTDESASIELVDLSEELGAAQVVSITFVFEEAGEVTVGVPIANPLREIDREEGYDFHTEEAEEAG